LFPLWGCDIEVADGCLTAAEEMIIAMDYSMLNELPAAFMNGINRQAASSGPTARRHRWLRREGPSVSENSLSFY
jgi:hypothetical protein